MAPSRVAIGPKRRVQTEAVIKATNTTAPITGRGDICVPSHTLAPAVTENRTALPICSRTGSLAECQHPQSLTRTFAELQAEGLITRAPSEQDRRASVLAITDAGRSALAQDLAQREAWLAGAMEALTETEQQVLVLAGRLMNQLADIPAVTARPERPSSEA
ncbi:hypothetical protein [Streptomyces sp. SID2888]|uniref:MarR family winged helix-turn-helix transcriptional regulator n=1 Tax=Streptomyces sp. SID2888 TaxID=2690256 RepID=UPI00136FD6CB|nr:hypothetical protein [Streptomyces sp. SID2888]MYV49424.1 hypothetical protein [Streptomyces sp. SID2888]